MLAFGLLNEFENKMPEQNPKQQHKMPSGFLCCHTRSTGSLDTKTLQFQCRISLAPMSGDGRSSASNSLVSSASQPGWRARRKQNLPTNASDMFSVPLGIPCAWCDCKVARVWFVVILLCWAFSSALRWKLLLQFSSCPHWSPTSAWYNQFFNA